MTPQSLTELIYELENAVAGDPSPASVETALSLALHVKNLELRIQRLEYATSKEAQR